MMPEKNVERRSVIKQLCIFLIICLPVSWLLEGRGYALMSEAADGASVQSAFSPTGTFLLNFSCFMPAIAALITCVVTRESIWNLKLLPNLKGNGRVYLSAILAGTLLSILGNGVMLLVFPEVAGISGEATALRFFFSVMYAVGIGTIQFFILMGEEVGWMGFLFPKLEKLCGTTPAILFTGLIRAGWHIVMLMQNKNFAVNLITLAISNVLLGSILVLVTKAGNSVVPAAIVHALTNTVPGTVMGFMLVNETLYQANYLRIYLVTLIPDVIIAGICYYILVKKYKGNKAFCEGSL